MVRSTLLLILATLPLGALHAAPPETRELEVEGSIDIGPDGAVRRVTLQPGLPDAVADVVQRGIAAWRFEAVAVDGAPVSASTRVELELEAVPLEDGFVLRVADVDLGMPRQARNEPPEYPAEALRAGIGAKVALLLLVDAAGNVADVHVEQVSMTEEPGKRAEFHRERFAAASAAVARQWKYEITEFIDGKPAPATIRVPVDFSLSGGAWTTGSDHIPGPVHPAPWPEGAALELVDDPVGTHL